MGISPRLSSAKCHDPVSLFKNFRFPCQAKKACCRYLVLRVPHPWLAYIAKLGVDRLRVSGKIDLLSRIWEALVWFHIAKSGCLNNSWGKKGCVWVHNAEKSGSTCVVANSWLGICRNHKLCEMANWSWLRYYDKSIVFQQLSVVGRKLSLAMICSLATPDRRSRKPFGCTTLVLAHESGADLLEDWNQTCSWFLRHRCMNRLFFFHYVNDLLHQQCT